jgi:hypothetical protein
MGRKNIQGGKKTKGLARKDAGSYHKDIRKPESEEEEYVMVTQVSGSGRFRVVNDKGMTYVGVLPGSMRGRMKRNSYVQLNSFLLINNRSSWQTMKPLAHVSIEYVYSEDQSHQLHLYDLFKVQRNESTSNSSSNNANEANIEFSNTSNDVSLLPNQESDTESVVEDEIDIDLI